MEPTETKISYIYYYEGNTSFPDKYIYSFQYQFVFSRDEPPVGSFSFDFGCSLDTSDTENYIAYENLTEETMLSWIPEAEYNANLEIAKEWAQDNFYPTKIVAPTLPWDL